MYVLSGDALKSVTNESQVSGRLKGRYDTHKKKKRETPRRAPRKSQKKARLVEFDPDISSSDNDLSLGRRYSNIAIRISSAPVFINHEDYNLVNKRFHSLLTSLSIAADLAAKLKKTSHKLYESYEETIKHASFDLMHDFKSILEYVKENPNPNPENPFFVTLNTFYTRPRKDIQEDNDRLFNWLSTENTAINQDYRLSFRLKIRDLIVKIKNDWEEGKSSWGKKASILRSIKDEIEIGFSYPKEFIEFFVTDPHNLEKVKEQLKEQEESIRKNGEIKKIDLPKNITDDDFVRFAALSSIYKSLCSNPMNPDFTKLYDSADEHTAAMYKEVRELKLLNEYMEKYLENMKKLIGDEDEDENGYEFGDYDKVVDIIDKSGTHAYSSVFDLNNIKKAYYDYFKKEGKGIPKPLMEKFGKASEKTASVQSSNKTGNDKMRKTAMYHGVLIQGGPDGPTNTGWKSIDKRYIGEKHYESILASARDMLKENPWFESNWHGGSSDAPVRAALDLAIATADGAIYQSKIDSPTYEILLNKLAGWEYDLMKDTVLNIHSNPKKRKASTDYDLMLNDLKYLK